VNRQERALTIVNMFTLCSAVDVGISTAQMVPIFFKGNALLVMEAKQDQNCMPMK